MFAGAPGASSEAGKTKGNLGRSSFGGKSPSKAFWMVSHVDGKTHASISSHLPDRMAETLPPATEHTKGGAPTADAGENSIPRSGDGSYPAAWRISARGARSQEAQAGGLPRSGLWSERAGTLLSPEGGDTPQRNTRYRNVPPRECPRWAEAAASGRGGRAPA